MISTSSPTEAPSRVLLERARGGDQVAWRTLFELCYPKVLRVVRRRLNWPLRKYYDSADIANEVMKSLAAKFDEFDFSSINGLQAFLVRAAEQKLIDSHRRGHAQKRDVTRDRAYSGAESGAWELADSSPTASQIAVASEEEEILLEGRSGPERDVLKMKIQGFTNNEVALQTGWNLRKVERYIEKLRGKCRF
jgi:RNA polymerase sigma factor (sigma-70 family)